MLNQGDFSTKLVISMWKYGYGSWKSLTGAITIDGQLPFCMQVLVTVRYRQWRHCTVVKKNTIICLSKNILDCWCSLRNAVIITYIMMYGKATYFACLKPWRNYLGNNMFLVQEVPGQLCFNNPNLWRYLLNNLSGVLQREKINT